MIKTFRYKGLRRFFENGSTAGGHARRLRMRLAALDTAHTIEDMDIPGFGLHPLKGELRGRGSIMVSGNGRMTFSFKDANAYMPDYEDDHEWRCTLRPTRVSSSPTSYLSPHGISGRELAAKLDVAASTCSRVLKGTSRVTPEMALRLKAIGRGPERWLAMQHAHDEWIARQSIHLQRWASSSWPRPEPIVPHDPDPHDEAFSHAYRNRRSFTAGSPRIAA